MKRIKPRKNILALVVGKQLVGEEDAATIEFPLLVCVDAAKRGRATGAQANTITQHLLAAVIVWAKMGNRALYDEAAAAWAAMCKACARPTDQLDLTTSEYKAIKKAIQHYTAALPRLEIALLSHATGEALKTLNKDAPCPQRAENKCC